MASVLHGSARTTPCLRAEFQASQESTRSLAARYGLNPKTVAKWRKRTTTADAPMGPTVPKSTVLTPAEGKRRRDHTGRGGGEDQAAAAIGLVAKAQGRSSSMRFCRWPRTSLVMTSSM